jgi:hypothetical protein
MSRFFVVAHNYNEQSDARFCFALAQKSLLEKPALLAAQKPHRARPLWRKMFNGTALLLCEPKLYLAGVLNELCGR